MSLPFVSLNAATATGAGDSRDLEGSFDHHTLIVSSTGGASINVALEGSHDGTTWVTLANAASGQVTVPNSGAATGPLIRYVRANLTMLSGGSSPTVTATIASETDGEE